VLPAATQPDGLDWIPVRPPHSSRILRFCLLVSWASMQVDV
jgi:hypothetical protein